MSCEHWFPLINASMDGELPADERERLSAHLGECASCRYAADEFEKGDRELARFFSPHQDAAARVADRVLEDWLTEMPLSSTTSGYWRVSLAAAAGFALAFFLFGLQSIRTMDDGDEVRIRAMVSQWEQGNVPAQVSELDLRALGAAAVVPLLDIVNDWTGDANAPKRIAAARLVADLAESTQIPAMIALLGDRSARIRDLSEATLVRLTGWNRLGDLQADQGAGPGSPPVGSCSNPQADWQQWWEENKARFPEADAPKIPATNVVD
ncbi:MAG: anti-sigma factor family protein [Rubripirellula sp.]